MSSAPLASPEKEELKKMVKMLQERVRKAERSLRKDGDENEAPSTVSKKINYGLNSPKRTPFAQIQRNSVDNDEVAGSLTAKLEPMRVSIDMEEKELDMAIKELGIQTDVNDEGDFAAMNDTQKTAHINTLSMDDEDIDRAIAELGITTGDRKSCSKSSDSLGPILSTIELNDSAEETASKLENIEVQVKSQNKASVASEDISSKIKETVGLSSHENKKYSHLGKQEQATEQREASGISEGNLNSDSKCGNITMTFSMTSPIGLKFAGREIMHVKEESAARRMGVRAGWRILTINDKDVGNTTKEILATFRSTKSEEVSVTFEKVSNHERKGSSDRLRRMMSRKSFDESLRSGRKIGAQDAVTRRKGGVRRQRKTMKVIVIGNPKCGKTSVVNRFVNGKFDPKYKSTIGCDYHSRDIIRKNAKVRLQLWDIAGQDRFIKLTRAYYRNAAGAIIVCDVSRPATLNSVMQWKKELDESLLSESKVKIPVILIANKVDLLTTGTTSFLRGAEIQRMSQAMNFDSWFIGSAKADQNINEAMNFLVEKMLAERLKLEKSRKGKQQPPKGSTLRLKIAAAEITSQNCCN